MRDRVTVPSDQGGAVPRPRVAVGEDQARRLSWGVVQLDKSIHPPATLFAIYPLPARAMSILEQLLHDNRNDR